jgi:hypothetical protein
VLRFKKSVLFSSLSGLSLVVLLGGCANSPWAESLERSLAADPRLNNNPVTFGLPAVPEAISTPTTAQLPANFPGEIPRYQNAELIAVTAPEASELTVAAGQSTRTRWRTSDSAEQVQQFYREQFQTAGWQLQDRSGTASPAAAPTLVAVRDGLQVEVTVETTAAGTEFNINYQFDSTAATPPKTPPATVSETAALPQPGDPEFIGPVWPSDGAGTTASPTANPANDSGFADLNQAPAELQPYLTDLAKLGVLPLQAGGTATAQGGSFQPNQQVTRREFARWLVTANNAIHANQPARKIRLATATDQPAFQDVPATDPDFAVIQGLANAGVIPSPLAGDATTVTFRPDAPLTRQDLILWKVPLDTRQALPTATLDAVKQTWGFQDAAQISPEALRAVLADFQNSDLSNIRRAFGYTTILQPLKPVSRAEAAAVLWYFGAQGDGLTAKDVLAARQATNPTASQTPAVTGP